MDKVYGIGTNGKNSRCKEYLLWNKMLYRCTKECSDKHKTYTDATCSENFKNYSFFYGWCQEQVGFGNKDENGRAWQLDKDILVKGNKAYSEDVCVFVPHRINSLLTKRDAKRGNHPLGVYLQKTSSKYVAYCSMGKSKNKCLGSFITAQEAFQAYKTFKEQLIKEVANEYRAQLDTRAYQALMNYEVNIND